MSGGRGIGARSKAIAITALTLAVAMVVPIPIEAAQATAPDLSAAREAFSADRFLDARDTLQALLAAHPDDGAANLLMGRTLLVLGELDAAERHLAVAADAPSTGERFMVPHTLGLVELRRRDPAAAEGHFDQAIALAPGYAGSRIARAQARAFQGEVEGALEDLRAVEASPRPQPAARVLTGELLLASGDFEGAFAAFQRVGDAGADDVPAAENAAMYLGTMAPDPAATESRILRGMGRVMGRAQPYFWLGIVRRDLGRIDEARQALRVALAVDELHAPSWIALRALPDPPPDVETAIGPPIPGLEYRLGSLRAALDAEPERVEPVQAAVAELLRARPLLVPAHLILAEVARRQGRPAHMLTALGELLEVAPWLVSVHAERAVLARELGAHRIAEVEARRAVALLPEDGSLRFLLATILMAGGNAEGAAEAAEAAIARDYDMAQVRVLLGNAYQELQRVPEAVEQLTRAVEMDPAVAEEIAAFALTAMAAEDSDRLVQLLERVRTENPGGPNVLYTLASLHLRRGELERAAELYERLLEIVPGRSEIHYNLALAYRRLGRERAADEQTALFERLKAEEDRLFEQANVTYRRRTEAVAALAAGDPGRAVELLRQVVGAPGSDPTDHTLLGSALLGAGQPRAAAEAYSATLEANPFDVSALCGAAAAARDLGEATEVAALLARVTALGESCPDTASAPPERGRLDQDPVASSRPTSSSSRLSRR